MIWVSYLLISACDVVLISCIALLYGQLAGTAEQAAGANYWPFSCVGKFQSWCLNLWWSLQLTPPSPQNCSSDSNFSTFQLQMRHQLSISTVPLSWFTRALHSIGFFLHGDTSRGVSAATKISAMWAVCKAIQGGQYASEDSSKQ